MRKKLPAPLPKSFWTIVDPAGHYRIIDGFGIPELFKTRWEATNQNIGVKNGDRVIKVTLYHPINNFKRK
jgi:hypothetical protein